MDPALIARSLLPFAVALWPQVEAVLDPPAPDPRSATLESVVQAWHEAGLYRGTVLVAEGERVLWQGGVGPADRAFELPNGPSVRYPIASLTKQFTAVLVLRRVEAGELGLDTTVAEVLPWYRRDTGERIRVRDLLSHASGLPDAPGELYRDEQARAEEARWVVETFCSGELDFEPGTQSRYTNADYHLLGAMLEAVAGRRFEEILRDEVIEPLGLTDTGIARRLAVQPRRARDYVPAGEGWQHAPPLRWEVWGAAGGMISSVGDVHRWNLALMRHELLSAETTALMNASRPDLGYVALGHWVYPRRLPGSELAPTLVERRGAIGGFAVLNVFEPKSERSIVLLANHYDEGIHTLPYARCLPLDLLLVLHGLEPEGPPPAASGSR